MGVQQDKLAQVFDAAAELSNPAERAAYLDAACGPDQQFRAEVEELLEHDQAASSFLSKGAQASPADVDGAPVREGPGTVLGPYKLLEQIGEGGFGVVFMAEQARPVRRRVEPAAHFSWRIFSASPACSLPFSKHLSCPSPLTRLISSYRPSV